MAKQVVLLLLSAFISNALALKCYDCTSQTSGTCTNQVDCKDNNTCVSIAATATGDVELNYTSQSCLPTTYCVNGSASMGFSKESVASRCCNTDLCNKDIPAVSIETKHNGRKCCTTQDCFKIVSCVGDEDQCFNATVSFSIFKIQTRGCTTKSFCNELHPIGLLNNISANVNCCDKDFCNGVEKLTLGFFLMMVPLLSSILFY